MGTLIYFFKLFCSLLFKGAESFFENANIMYITYAILYVIAVFQINLMPFSGWVLASRP